jgi:CRP/FNR family transcriptional regulator, anaerobic regulatory protein
MIQINSHPPILRQRDHDNHKGLGNGDMASSLAASPRKEADLSRNFLAEKNRACSYCEMRGKGFCSHLSENHRALLAEFSRLVTLDAHKTLFRQGEESESVYVVRSGMLRLYQRMLDGRRQVIGFAKASDILLFPLCARNDYSADALDSVYLCQFRRQDFQALLQRDSAFLCALAIVTHDELLRARSQIALLSQRKAEPKMAQFLLALAESCARPDSHGLAIPVRVPQADIADYLGMTVETVNRTMARLVRDAIIGVGKHGIDLLDPKRLREIAETY